MARIYNFSAGPATLPTEVLEEVRDELLDYKGSGASIMESSHRGKEYDAAHQEAMANIRQLLELSDDYEVLFLQGGATGQFAMIPMNLLGEGQTADYVNTGAWADKAIKEARIIGKVNVAADCGKDIPTRMPNADEYRFSENAAYVHITPNETISGTQMKDFPEVSAPLLADMSSEILSRRIPVERFGMMYAGAQKNLGPSGVAVVIMRKELAERCGEKVPLMYRYKTHMDKQSLYNTPPSFGIYIISLVTRWVIQQGGLDAMEVINQRKSAKLYDLLDRSDFFSGTAVHEHRSPMNVTFRLPSEDLEARFVAEAARQDMKGLKGHRSVGGIRASIYNAFPESGVDALISFMEGFEASNG